MVLYLPMSPGNIMKMTLSWYPSLGPYLGTKMRLSTTPGCICMFSCIVMCLYWTGGKLLGFLNTCCIGICNQIPWGIPATFSIMQTPTFVILLWFCEVSIPWYKVIYYMCHHWHLWIICIFWRAQITVMSKQFYFWIQLLKTC